MVGVKAMEALGQNSLVGAELFNFVPTTTQDQVNSIISLSLPQLASLVVGKEGEVAIRQPTSRSRTTMRSALEGVLALENILSLRTAAAPSTAGFNARAWAKWSTLFLTHDWVSVVAAFEQTRLLCELERSWDWSRDIAEAHGLLKMLDFPSPLKQETQRHDFSRAFRQESQASHLSVYKRKLSKEGFDALLQKCTPISACAKFQTGMCQERGDHGRPDAPRKHICWKCQSTAHGGESCPKGEQPSKKAKS